MAELTLKIGNTGETIPVNDLDLDQVTNEELLSQLAASGMVPVEQGKKYRIIGNNNQPITETATLSSLGITDGQTVTIIAKPEGAAELTLRIGNTGEIIPVNDLDLDQVTNEELLSQLAASGMVPLEQGMKYRIIGANNQPITETGTLSSLGIEDGQTVTIVAKPEGAAELTLKIGNTGETIPVNDLDLDQVTNEELLSQLAASGMVPVEQGKKYRIIGNNNQPITETATLSSLGITDGQTVTIIAKPEGAAELTLRIGNTGEIIPVNDLDLDQVTNEELLSQLAASGMVPVEQGKKYRIIGSNNQPITETATLSSLGITDGQIVTIIAKPEGANA